MKVIIATLGLLGLMAAENGQYRMHHLIRCHTEILTLKNPSRDRHWNVEEFQYQDRFVSRAELFLCQARLKSLKNQH